jgi:predicted dehydrogenase
MIRIAIVGTGGMANAHATSFKGIRGCKLVAACDIKGKRARDFARRHGIAPDAVFTDVHDLLKAVDCDAVSIVASDAAHAPLSLACIAAGKHVLCEKPLATNYADARRMAEAARKRGVINMVNLSYRNASAIHKAAQLVRQGAIGRVIHFDASYLQSWLVSNTWGDWRAAEALLWRLSTRHGSKGTLGDIGVHILDFATYPIGEVASVHCRLKTYPKARGNRIGRYVLDANDSAVITLEMANGALGAVHTSRWATGHVNSLQLRIFGDRGAIRIDLDRSYSQLEICRGGDVNRNAWKTLRCGRTPSIYRRFIRSILTGRNDQPDFARGAGVQRILDACFVSNAHGGIVKL